MKELIHKNKTIHDCPFCTPVTKALVRKKRRILRRQRVGGKLLPEHFLKFLRCAFTGVFTGTVPADRDPFPPESAQGNSGFSTRSRTFSNARSSSPKTGCPARARIFWYLVTRQIQLEAAYFNSSPSSISSSKEITSLTPSSPLVRVPVLSKITAFMARAFSKASLCLINNPSLAEIAVDTAITSGMASPNAWGQESPITVTVRSNENAKSIFPGRTTLEMLWLLLKELLWLTT